MFKRIKFLLHLAAMHPDALLWILNVIAGKRATAAGLRLPAHVQAEIETAIEEAEALIQNPEGL